jgi:hypothetical protein
MNRIDPQVVAAVFGRHNIRPERQVFTVDSEDDGLVACCGTVAALVDYEEHHPCSREWTTGELDEGTTPVAADLLASALGLDPVYILGFIDGWDDFHDRSFSPADVIPSPYHQGFLDGAGAWEAAAPYRSNA